MNKEEINRLLSEYESTVHQINELKVEAEILKRELLLEESKIALYPKEQWKALDISNAEGRKAYAVIALQDLKFEVSDVLNEVSQLELIMDLQVEKLKVACLIYNNEYKPCAEEFAY